MSLVREIQAAAQDSSVDLGALLRKCLVLARRLKHTELAEWVSHELNGYGDNEALPQYRTLTAQSFGHFTGAFGSSMSNAPIAKAQNANVV